MTLRSFAGGLAAICVAALALRLVYALVVVGDAPLLGDGLQFHTLANLNAEGHWFVQERLFLDQGIERPTADKPPLYTLLLTAVSAVGGTSWQWHHLVGVLCGVGTVAVCGLLARRLAGPRTGLVAAALAAVWPALVATDGSLRSEAPYALLVALALLLAVLLHDTGRARWAAALGAVIGLAALTRGEAVLLLAVLAAPAALLARRPGGLRHVALATAAALLVLTPWLARTWAALDHPVLISTNTGGLMAGANCPKTYAGPMLGQWAYDCLRPAWHRNEAEVSADQRRAGLRYAADHAGRLPVVVAARLGRTFEVFRPRQNAQFMAFFEGRDLRVAQLSVLWLWLALPLALAGAVLLQRRGRRVWWLIAGPVVVVVAVTVSAYGWTRFRVALEPALVVFTAVAVVEGARRVAALSALGSAARRPARPPAG